MAGGIPRVINLLCDMTLAYGYADQSLEIDSNTVFEVLASGRGATRARVLS